MDFSISISKQRLCFLKKKKMLLNVLCPSIRTKEKKENIPKGCFLGLSEKKKKFDIFEQPLHILNSLSVVVKPESHGYD